MVGGTVGSGGFVGGGLVTVCMVVMQMCAREQLYTGYLDITVCIGVVGSHKNTIGVRTN